MQVCGSLLNTARGAAGIFLVDLCCLVALFLYVCQKRLVGHHRRLYLSQRLFCGGGVSRLGCFFNLRHDPCVAPKHVGIIGYMALSCSTVGEALLRYARYQRLVYDGNPGSVIADGDAIEIRWGIERGTPGQLVDETAISLFISYVRFLVEEPMRPMLITFVNPPPADLTPYTDFFGCPVRFNDTVTRVRFPLSHMTRELKQRDPALMDLLSQQAEALLVALPAADSFYDRLRSSIVRCIHDGTPDLPSVAGLMTMSTRTLQRRLQEKELEFNLVLDKIRSELAQRYLADKHQSFTDIALLLGYSEQSAFTRAFKRWFGVTPRDFKRGIGR